MMKAVILALATLGFASGASAQKLEAGGTYCSQHGEHAFVFKVITVDASEVYVRQFALRPECPKGLEASLMAEPLQVVQATLESLGSAPQPLGKGDVSSEEQAEAEGLKRAAKYLEDEVRKRQERAAARRKPT